MRVKLNSESIRIFTYPDKRLKSIHILKERSDHMSQKSSLVCKYMQQGAPKSNRLLYRGNLCIRRKIYHSSFTFFRRICLHMKWQISHIPCLGTSLTKMQNMSSDNNVVADLIKTVPRYRHLITIKKISRPIRWKMNNSPNFQHWHLSALWEIQWVSKYWLNPGWEIT